MMTLYFDVLAQNYRCLGIIPYFSSKIGIWPLIADVEDHMTLYFDVLAQNYSCSRIVSYFSSKIGLPLVAEFEDQLYGDFVF